MYICIYVYMYTCIYVYMYICIYVYMYMLYANAFILNIYQGVLELQERYEVCLLSLLWLFLSIIDCGRGLFSRKAQENKSDI